MQEYLSCCKKRKLRNNQTLNVCKHRKKRRIATSLFTAYGPVLLNGKKIKTNPLNVLNKKK